LDDKDQSQIAQRTINGFSTYLKKIKPDLVIIHGDRIDALACAMTASIMNYKLAHIEGGDVTGNYDEIIRHAITKFSHVHFVSNLIAKKRLLRLGESKKNIFKIGSTNIDTIINKKLPIYCEVQKKYNIDFEDFGICIFHSDEVKKEKQKNKAKILEKFLKNYKNNLVVIYPNNDPGSDEIINSYKKIKSKNIKLLVSMRFDYFMSLLKKARFIIGNSSSGIIESPYLGTPTINVGDRQKNRASIVSIKNIRFNYKNIRDYSNKYYKLDKKYKTKKKYFGTGNSTKKFVEILKKKNIWDVSVWKHFSN
jgi:UDP-N-acetylglucosamine 2-epimerase (hydrolysing)